MSKYRWSKFWWQDWQRDPALRMCSLAARGLWMELLCVAHEGDPYGHVTVNGRPLMNRQIATIAGVTEKEATKLLAELELGGVFSRTDDGVIFSRRMVRDREASEVARQHGAQGGNPSLVGRSSKSDKRNPSKGVNPTHNPPPILQEEEADTEDKAEATLLTAAAVEQPQVVDIRAELWGEGLALLRGLTGKPEGPMRGLLGKFLKSAHDDCALVLAKLRAAADLRPAEPVAWITAAIGSDDDENARILAAAGLTPDGKLIGDRTIDGQPYETQPRFLQ